MAAERKVRRSSAVVSSVPDPSKARHPQRELSTGRRESSWPSAHRPVAWGSGAMADASDILRGWQMRVWISASKGRLAMRQSAVPRIA
jgi:hypothetical protein